MEGNQFFLVDLQEEKYIIMGNFAISFVRFYCKEGKKLPEMETINCPLILIFNSDQSNYMIENFKIKLCSVSS